MDARLAPLALAISLFASPLPAQDAVWIVDDDGGPGVDFDNLADAVTVAADGDLLVFRDGVYPGGLFGPLVIDGKGLTLVADGDASLGWISVENLAPGQSFTIHGFQLFSSFLDFANNEGVVFLEDVGFDPAGAPHFATVSFDNCDVATMNRCVLTGIPAAYGISFNEPAVQSSFSALHLYDCLLTGGDGYVVPGIGFAPGNVGLSISNGFTFASGGELLPGLFGGAGAVQVGAAESIIIGVGGAFELVGGTLKILPGPARSFSADGVVREGQNTTLTWDAPAGELAVLVLASSPHGLFTRDFNGSTLLANPLLLVDTVGTVPGAGTLALDVAIPDLGAGIEGLVFYAQGAFVDPLLSSVHLGGGSVITVLDQAL
ncbi:MAG: hypothetical protein AAF682_01855 [Planctomycetota bacterium]